MINLNPTQKPLMLIASEVTVNCYGSVAETSVKMSFYNPNPWRMGGEVDFRLSNGCTLTGFAFETEPGIMREGVPIDRSMSYFSLGDKFSGGEDFPLMQEVRDEYHKFRVFPVEGQGTKLVEMRHVGNLMAPGKGSNDLLFNLPIGWSLEKAALAQPELDVGYTMTSFRFTMHVHGGAQTPYALTKDGEKVFFTKSGDIYSYEFFFDPNDDIPYGEIFDDAVNVVVPGEDQMGSRVQTTASGDYFYSAFNGSQIASLIRSCGTFLPKKVGIAWDSSLSGAMRNHRKELAFLDAYFNDLLRENGAEEVRVFLLNFCNDVKRVREYVVDRTTGWEKLRKELVTTIYDGATNFCAARAEMNIPVDEWLFFSDGCDNYGLHTEKEDSAVVHTITSFFPSYTTDLFRFATSSGGVLVDLTKMTPQEGVRFLRTPRVRLASMSGDKLSDLQAAAHTLEEDGILVVSGRLRGKEGMLRLTFEGRGKGNKKVSVNIPVSDDNPRSPLAATEWARRKRNEYLSEHIWVDEQKLRSLGREFGLVSPGTALAVLQDYIAPLNLEGAPEQKSIIPQSISYGRVSPPRREDERLYSVDRLREEWAVLLSQYGNEKRTANASDFGDRSDYFHETAPAYYRKVTIPGFVDVSMREYGDGASYLERLGSVSVKNAYEVYLSARPHYWMEPNFFLDTSNFFFRHGLRGLGLRVLSNLAEIDPENKWIVRTLAYRLMELESPYARDMFDKILKIDASDPQSRRDLAMLCARDGDIDEAVKLLHHVATRKWGREFKSVQLAALRDINVIVGSEPLGLGDRLPNAVLTDDADYHDLDIRATLVADRDNANLRLFLTDEDGNMIKDGLISFSDSVASNTDELIMSDVKTGNYLLKVGYAEWLPAERRVPTLALVSLATNVGKTFQSVRLKTVRLVPSWNGPETVMRFSFDAEQASYYEKASEMEMRGARTIKILTWLLLFACIVGSLFLMPGRR